MFAEKRPFRFVPIYNIIYLSAVAKTDFREKYMIQYNMIFDHACECII